MSFTCACMSFLQLQFQHLVFVGSYTCITLLCASFEKFCPGFKLL